MSLRNFVRLLFDSPERRTVTDESMDSLVKTVKDAVHVRSGYGPGPAIPGVAGNTKIYKMIAKGHKNYTDSFKSKKSHF